MIERPILFSAPMVRAILDGRKTQTRRIVKHAPHHETGRPEIGACVTAAGACFYERAQVGTKQETCNFFIGEEAETPAVRSRYGRPGDQLWVRENMGISHFGASYRADDTYFVRTDDAESDARLDWWFRHYDKRADHQINDDIGVPCIFMPRWASRIQLEITAVRVERLQDISKADAICEGLRSCSTGLPEGCPTIYGIEPGQAVEFEPKLADADPRVAYRGLWEHINGAGSWAVNPWIWVVEFRRVAS